jgi:hypothetical protein
VPQPPITSQERRLAALCRVLAVLYFAAALACALPVVAVSLDSAPLAVIAVAMTTAIAAGCLIAAARPRERRHVVVPALVAQFTAFALASAHLLAGHGGATLLAIAGLNLGLFVLTAAAWRSAAPGVHGVPAREGPPPAHTEEPPAIQLKVSKS